MVPSEVECHLLKPWNHQHACLALGWCFAAACGTCQSAAISASAFAPAHAVALQSMETNIKRNPCSIHYHQSITIQQIYSLKIFTAQSFQQKLRKKCLQPHGRGAARNVAKHAGPIGCQGISTTISLNHTSITSSTESEIAATPYQEVPQQMRDFWKKKRTALSSNDCWWRIDFVLDCTRTESGQNWIS